jgi:hypothetical protein
MGRLLFLPVLLVFVLRASAQEAARIGDAPAAVDSVIRRNTGSVIFDRNQNTYTWTGRLVVDTAFTGLPVHFSSLYTSSIVLLESASQKRKLQSNQLSLDLGTEVSLLPALALATRWSSLVYSDDRNVGLSNASSHTALAGVHTRTLDALDVTPLVGFRWDNQGLLRDRGPVVDISAGSRGAMFDGWLLEGAARFRTDDLAPRRMENHLARVVVQKSFDAQTRDSLDVGVTRNRREYYTLADSSIEARVENTFSVANLLAWGVDRHVTGTIFIGLAGRGLDKDARQRIVRDTPTPQFGSRIDEFRLETSIQGEYRSDDGRTAASMRLAYNERNEEHEATPVVHPSPALGVLFAERNRQEQTKNNLSRRSSFGASLTLPLSPSDDLALAGGASILRYDTPSGENVEDRDELLIALSLTTRHRLSRALEAAVTLDASLGHLVYLLAERSANNNINRVLRFAPQATWRPAWFFASANAFEVLANYTVYDYEFDVAQARSFSYRQFSFIDSTAVELTSRVGLDFLAYFKLYERGQLRWDEFTERPENAFADRTVAVYLRYRPVPALLVAAGVRSFTQRRYAYEDGNRRLQSTLTSIGPSCILRWEVGPHSLIDFRGWYERRNEAEPGARTTATMTLTALLTL